MRAGRRFLLGAGLAGAVLAAAAAWHVPILIEAGSLLETHAAPVKSDLLVVVRGDETYFERALAAADLFRHEYASYVYVSSALSDLAEASLGARGVRVSSPQETIASVLMQSGVPCSRILLDRSPPGGGTVGEFKRVDAALRARGFRSVLIVTSWFHARRARVIARKVIGQEGFSATVVAAASETGPRNWWHYRYLAITVLEEYAKLLMRLLPGRLEFYDDPGPENLTVSRLEPPSQCAAIESPATVTLHDR